ncbi:tyrosine-type recombinase/integrase [Dactylosporangium sp. NPDC000521]|uniref:tyrosine-type recombinase/integrase n=1 Tax=Dactylosporangium sp. NPDC000521 TaxID=3363975 RepID=UPI00369A21AE
MTGRARAHLTLCAPVPVSLPWEHPITGSPTTVRLVFTTTRRNAINRGHFNHEIWHLALLAAGIEPTRATGMHALRHSYASALLDGGESIKTLAAYLGHNDPAFTLRVYTHLMPSSDRRARNVIDNLYQAAGRVPATSQEEA